MKINILEADKLPYGYYMLKIQSEEPLIQSLFKFSTDNTYCHYSLINLQVILQYLLQDKKKKIDKLVSIEICGDAYIYDNDDLIDCNKIFGNWFDNVSKLKKDLPNNFLVKNLSTKLWGYLSQYNRIYVEEDDIDNYDKALYYRFSQKEKFDYLCIGIENPTKENSKYVLVDVNNAYKHNGIARIKSFLIASVRLYMTRIIIDNDLVDNVIRLCTDGIILNKRHNFESNKSYEYVPVSEKKTTGLIKFYHVNKYYHCCKYCKEEWKYNKSYTHECAK
jgi:hypothetical protein